MLAARQSRLQLFWIALALTLLFPRPAHSQNQVMGEIQFEGKTKVERDSGVWVDGEYVGYLKELKGSKKVMLLPGDHTLSVRQNGYEDFNQSITVRAGEKQIIQVTMAKAPVGQLPAAWSEVKIAVNPARAAVFLDGRLVGHVGEFSGAGRALLVAPGNHKIKIALPGYKSFETEINPAPNQKVEVKTDLLESPSPIEDPSLKGGGDNPTPPPSHQ